MSPRAGGEPRRLLSQRAVRAVLGLTRAPVGRFYIHRKTVGRRECRPAAFPWAATAGQRPSARLPKQPGPGPGPIATERVGAGGSPTTHGAGASRTVNGSPSPRASSDKNRFSSNSEYTSRAVQAVAGKTCIYTHDNNVGSHSPHTAAVEMRNHRISLERFPSLHWSCPRRWFPALP